METDSSHGKAAVQAGIWYRWRWIAVSALGLSMFLSALDATIVALALPKIANSLQLSDSLASTVFLAYAIPLTLLVLPSGAVLNRLPALPTFLASVLGFGLGSLVCGLSPNFATLLVGRVVKGASPLLSAPRGSRSLAPWYRRKRGAVPWESSGRLHPWEAWRVLASAGCSWGASAGRPSSSSICRSAWRQRSWAG